MTLDVTSFIDNKGGNSEVIRESQRKRGHSVEVVDEVIQMYQDWVKSTSSKAQILKKINTSFFSSFSQSTSMPMA
jgi:seryl-tRNA synthetase